jgi:hypothetical protein
MSRLGLPRTTTVSELAKPFRKSGPREVLERQA